MSSVRSFIEVHLVVYSVTIKCLNLIICHLCSARVESSAAFQLAKACRRKCKVGNKRWYFLFSPLWWIFCCSLSLFSPVSARLPAFYCTDAFETMRNSGSLKAAPSYAAGRRCILVRCRTGSSDWLKYISNIFRTKWDACLWWERFDYKSPALAAGVVSASSLLSCPCDCDDVSFEFLVAQFFFSGELWTCAVLQL